MAVTEVIDSQQFGRFNGGIAVWLFLLLLADGFDSGIMGVAAPHLIEAWGITDHSLLGPIFSMSVIGIMCGGPLFGYIGDHIGRKPVLMITSCMVGSATFMVAWVSTINELMVLRFITGVGIGGLTPLCFVLLAEFAPSRIRATLITAGGTGVALGIGSTGVVGATLVPDWGWQILFLIGGVSPIVISFFIYFFMPESLKYLTLSGDRNIELARVLKKMRPELVITPASVFFITDDGGPRRNSSLVELFSGRLALITPLLWFIYIMLGATLYFIVSWTPTILTTVGSTKEFASIASAAFHAGSIFSPIILGLLVDRFGIRPILIYLCLGVPLVAFAGFSAYSELLLLVMLFGMGFTLLGAQVGLLAITADMFYPARIRAEGVGFASGLQKMGGLVGALGGGYIIGLPIELLFAIAAVPMAGGAIGTWYLMRLQAANPLGENLNRPSSMVESRISGTETSDTGTGDDEKMA